MRKLYGGGGDGWVLASQLNTAINDALVAAGGKPISRQMFYKSVLGIVSEGDKKKNGRYLYVRSNQVDRWVAHAGLRVRKIQAGEWLVRHPWGDDGDEAFRGGVVGVGVSTSTPADESLSPVVLVTLVEGGVTETASESGDGETAAL